MRARQDNLSLPNAAQHHGCLSVAAVDINVLVVCRENLHPLAAGSCGIDKDAPAVKVGDCLLGQAVVAERVGGDAEPNGSGACLAVVLEALEGGAAVGAREEG
jgi:hypothetical protein